MRGRIKGHDFLARISLSKNQLSLKNFIYKYDKYLIECNEILIKN